MGNKENPERCHSLDPTVDCETQPRGHLLGTIMRNQMMGSLKVRCPFHRWRVGRSQLSPLSVSSKPCLVSETGQYCLGLHSFYVQKVGPQLLWAGF